MLIRLLAILLAACLLCAQASAESVVKSPLSEADRSALEVVVFAEAPSANQKEEHAYAGPAVEYPLRKSLSGDERARQVAQKILNRAVVVTANGVDAQIKELMPTLYDAASWIEGLAVGYQAFKVKDYLRAAEDLSKYAVSTWSPYASAASDPLAVSRFVAARVRLSHITGAHVAAEAQLAIQRLIQTCNLKSSADTCVAALDGGMALYESNGERKGLEGVVKSALALRDQTLGPLTVRNSLSAARILNRARHYTGIDLQRHYTSVAVDKVSVAKQSSGLADALLALHDELAQDPLHLTIVAPRQSGGGRVMFKSALNFPVTYRRIDFWDPAEGPMPNKDVQYPQLPEPAAFLCVNKRCSLPLMTSEEMQEAVIEFTRWKLS